MKLVFIVLACVMPTAALAVGECRNAPEVTFTWEWCSANKFENDVTNVCFGSLVYEDIVSSAVQIEKINTSGSSEGEFECLFASGAEWEEVQVPNCDYAIKREYMAAYGEQRLTHIVECNGENGVDHIWGQSLEKIEFDASQKQSLSRVRLPFRR